MADVSVPDQVRVSLRVLRATPALLYLAFIWLVSARPGDSLPTRVDDRIAHFGEYFLLMLLVMFALTAFDPVRIQPRTLLAAGGFSFAWAILDEVHQSFVPGRFPSVKDVAFDLVGIAAAAALMAFLATRDRRRA
ncbi:MAG: VanZ family protein [Thermoanaerobaculia bacterium]